MEGLFAIYGGVAEWLRHSISNLVGSTFIGSNQGVRAKYKPTANSAFHLLEVNEYLEATLMVQAIEPQAHSYMAVTNRCCLLLPLGNTLQPSVSIKKQVMLLKS